MSNTGAEFFTDLRRFGRERAFTRLKHRDRIREFALRQRQLATIGAVEIAFFIFSQHPVFSGLALLFFTTATRECWRMRACGRYWECKRSVEVIGI